MAIHAVLVDRMDQETDHRQLKMMNAFENAIIFYAADNGASAEMLVRDGGDDSAASPWQRKILSQSWTRLFSACKTPFRRHEGGISTPLVVHSPAGVQAKGELRHAAGHLIDTLLPTVLELTSVTKPKEMKGEATPESPGRSLRGQTGEAVRCEPPTS